MKRSNLRQSMLLVCACSGLLACASATHRPSAEVVAGEGVDMIVSANGQVDGPPETNCQQARNKSAMQCRDAIKNFRIEGRMAVSNGVDAGSANFTWAQDGEYYDMELRIGLTGQVFRLSGDAHTAMLDGVAENPLVDTNAERLLQRETGFSLPFNALQSWVRGVAHQDDALVAYDEEGELQSIQEQAWQIEYDGFIATETTAMPERIKLERGDNRVRLVIARWVLKS